MSARPYSAGIYPPPPDSPRQTGHEAGWETCSCCDSLKTCLCICEACDCRYAGAPYNE